MVVSCSPSAIRTVKYCTGTKEHGRQFSGGCGKRGDRRRLVLPFPCCRFFQMEENSVVQKKKDIPRGAVGCKAVGSGDSSAELHVSGPPGEDGSSKPPAWNSKTVIAIGRTFSDKDIRVALRWLWLSGFMGVGSLVGLVVFIMRENLKNGGALLNLVKFNFATALLCVLVMIPCTAWYVWCLVRVICRGGVFDHRERWDHLLNLALFLSQCVNCIFYLVPTAIALLLYGEPVDPIGFIGSAFIRFTMWNNIYWIFTLRTRLSNPWIDSEGKPVGDRVDSQLVDAPFWKHWYLPIPWLVYQALLIWSTCLLLGVTKAPDNYIDLCEKAHERAHHTMRDEALTTGIMVGMLIHQLIQGLFTCRGYAKLKRVSYKVYRWTSIKLRYHSRHCRNIMLIAAFCFPILYSITKSVTIEQILFYFGLMPAQILMTMQSAINCILAAPAMREDYSEEEIDVSRLVWMDSPAAGQKRTVNQIDHTHKFCFETALKTRFWSWAAYNYDRERKEIKDPEEGPPQAMALAMQMYDLTNQEYKTEEEHDSNMLIAWNNQTVVLSFRGTASRVNAITDVKAWRISYPPKKGIWLRGIRSAVHVGFADSWRKLNSDKGVVEKVKKIVGGKDFDKPNSKVIITGHSLGGAMAILAAYDIASELDEGGVLPKEQILCYTFGAPRVGNSAFASKYDSQVPNTWQVINDSDVVPSLPKFGVLYRHVGRKVLINTGGDLIVSPTIMEFSLRMVFSSFFAVVSDHYLDDYKESFVRILKCEGKGLEGGDEAVPEVLDKSDGLLSKVYGVRSDELTVC